MPTVTILDVTRTLPEEWNKCSKRQLEMIADALNQSLSDQDLLMRLFLALWIQGKDDVEGQDAFWRFMRKIEKAQKIKDREKREHEVATLGEDLMVLCEQTTAFILEDVNGLTRNPYPTLRAGKKELHGPADDLGNMTGGEFAVAEKYMGEWMEDKKESALDRLVATLWRPKREDYDSLRHTDIRVPFVITQPELLARWTKKLRLEQKLLALQFYRSCREQIVEANPHVFTEENEEEASKLGWLGLFLELGGGLLGYQQIANEPVAVIMADLKRLHEKAAKAKKNN